MRLPARTDGQKQVEDSRQFNEQLYATFLAGVPLTLPIAPWNWREEQLRIARNPHKFWDARGFRVRTRTDKAKTLLTVWLEQGAPKRRVLRGEAMRAAKKVGPVVGVVCGTCGWQGERKRAWDDFSFGACRECGGDLKVRPKPNLARADAKAKRELAEQEGAA